MSKTSLFVALADVRAVDPDLDETSEMALLPFDQAIGVLESDAGAPWAADVLKRSWGRSQPSSTTRH